MKKIILIIILLVNFGALSAQDLQIDLNGAQLPSDTVHKDILDNARYRIFYNYDYARVATHPNYKIHSLTLLQIGREYNKFMDYYNFKADSINDFNARKNTPPVKYMYELMNILKLANFESNIITNNTTKEQTTQRPVGSDNYQYIENIPQIMWNFVDGDTIIEGYACKKATTTLYGRNWTAWYAPEVNIPYGPYKFGGLPGLIFHIRDSENNFIFSLCGLESINYYDPVYIEKETIATKRDVLTKMEKNYNLDPIAVSLKSGKVRYKDEFGNEITSGDEIPYNPIERE